MFIILNSGVSRKRAVSCYMHSSDAGILKVNGGSIVESPKTNVVWGIWLILVINGMGTWQRGHVSRLQIWIICCQTRRFDSYTNKIILTQICGKGIRHLAILWLMYQLLKWRVDIISINACGPNWGTKKTPVQNWAPGVTTAEADTLSGSQSWGL